MKEQIISKGYTVGQVFSQSQKVCYLYSPTGLVYVTEIHCIDTPFLTNNSRQEEKKD